MSEDNIVLSQEKPIKKTRNSNIELFRIITMLLIVAHHYVVNSGLTAADGRMMAYYFVSDSNTFLAVMTGVCSFLFFKNLKIKNSRIINTVAASTFGVLLIHANSNAMRRWLWQDTLKNVEKYGSSLLPLYAIGSVLAVFFVCVIIDQIRIHLIEKPFFKFWDKHWDKVVAKCKKTEERISSRFDAQK